MGVKSPLQKHKMQDLGQKCRDLGQKGRDLLFSLHFGPGSLPFFGHPCLFCKKAGIGRSGMVEGSADRRGLPPRPPESTAHPTPQWSPVGVAHPHHVIMQLDFWNAFGTLPPRDLHSTAGGHFGGDACLAGSDEPCAHATRGGGQPARRGAHAHVRRQSTAHTIGSRPGCGPRGLELQPTKTKVWAPNMENVMANQRLAHLERQNPSGGGLLIVGEALGAEDEEAQVLGTSPFVHAHLRKIADLVAQDCVRIQHLPEELVAQEAGMQLGFALLQRTLPSRILHLLRGHATEHTTELSETLTTHMRTVLRNWLGHPALTAANWGLAHLPITAGGLGLPDLQALALAARTAALATIPNEGQLAAYKEELLAREGPALLDQLQARLAHPVAELVGDLRHIPAGKSTRQLSRKLMHINTVSGPWGERKRTCQQPCGMRGHATAPLMVARPPPATLVRGHGSEPSPEARRTPSTMKPLGLTLVSDWVWIPLGQDNAAGGPCDWGRAPSAKDS